MQSIAARDWQHWGGTAAGTRYAPFDQINASNVDKLEIAWTYRTGVGGAFKATPLQIGDTLYVCLARNIIAALDADTGAERWRFDPQLKDSKVGFTTTCRGVTYFKAPEPPRRVSRANSHGHDRRAADRRRCEDRASAARDFGTNGEVTLLAGMGDVKPGFYYVTSPPTLAKGVAVLGGWVADNVETQEPSGVVRGFDPISGRLLWAWDLGRPDVLDRAAGRTDVHARHAERVERLQRRRCARAWSTSRPATRRRTTTAAIARPESERFASSVVALDAATGAVRWSFQTTHHDIWDYDVPSQPVLVDLPAEDGSVTPALVAPTKRGELFLLDRRDGKPLATVEEQTGAADRPAGRADLEDAAVLGRHAVVRQRPRDGSEDVGHHADRSDATAASSSASSATKVRSLRPRCAAACSIPASPAA